MGKYQLLSVFQYAILFSLLIIGATTYFAIDQDKMARARVQSEGSYCAVVDPTGSTELGRRGKTIWNANVCGSCHNKNMRDDATGPALGGVESRWAGEPREHLYRWVRQSQALIESGESARAVQVHRENDRAVMANYTNLTDEDVEALLAYISDQYAAK
ncbi:c-type cytochrome [Neolewinella antarctica]|uniref:Mono/diheme cytochrome c family protein n=1 Tax=Neolewinella antarctica TaxID=442734 RepID=A0ABX0XFN4_9BACT|nr:cytochrome c [Neolewinella antarctica]NJC28136.1 mono/diheme cytochrome c family protein [Neolewinella antarctica]